jgi:PAS domain S-box-containing protein
MSAMPSMGDITERKLGHESLVEREERFRLIADSCPSMMWAADANGHIQFLNRTCREFCGMAHDEMEGSGWHSSIHPDDAADYLTAYNRAIGERTQFSREVRFRRADGEWRLLGLRAEPRFSSKGQYIGLIGLGADITERIREEKEREFELTLMQSIHDETLEGILVVNSEGIIVSHNRRFLEIWRIPDPTAPGQPAASLVGSQIGPVLLRFADSVESPETFIRRIMELYALTDEVDHCEVRLKDGRTLDRRSTSLLDQEGQTLGRVWFYRDITVPKEAALSLLDAKALAEEAYEHLLKERSILEKERMRLRTLIDNIPDFLYVKDAEGRFVLSNSSVARQMGAEKPGDLQGKTDFDIYPSDLARAFQEEDRDIITTGKPVFNREEMTRDGSGNEIHVLTTKVPLRDSDGRVVGIVGIGRDISSRKKVENALREAERNYRGIFDNAIVGIYQTTSEGRILSVNPAMATIFGYDSPQTMISCITDIPRQLYADPMRRAELALLMDQFGAVQNFEAEVFRKDGSKIWLEIGARAIRENGVTVRYEGMCEDITERKQLRDQLLQAQKLESVGQLAAGIAHEINTPTQYIGDNVRFLKDAFRDLTSVLTNYEKAFAAAKNIGFTPEAIRQVAAAVEHADVSFLVEEIPKAIDQAHEGVARVSKLVSAMKEFSHPGTKEKVLLDLNRAIDTTITVARNEWKYVAELETDFDPSLPPISCHPGEFNQVILNLIVNAAHAIADVIKDGGSEKGMIEVQTRNCPEWAEVRIRDNGTGIPEKVRTRIFDPFFTTKEIGKGTGQGLAISRSVIVNQHGGSLDFETEEGKGTTFIVRLPHNGKALAEKVVGA